jgi:hypothetical protein
MLKEIIKLGPAIAAWSWAKLGYILAIVLLLKGSVNFDQAIVLALLACFGEAVNGVRRRGHR